MIAISPATHYDLYHDWRKALEFCRALPDVAPQQPVTFHMFWRERSGGLLLESQMDERLASLGVCVR